MCATADRMGTLIYLAVGILCIYGSIALLVWRLSRGELHPPSLLGGLVVFSMGVFQQWHAFRRHRQTGVFVIDRAAREIRDVNHTRSVSFDRARRIRLVFDPLETLRLDRWPELPLWLTIEFNEGSVIRIGKGTRTELVPLLNWLVATDIPYVS